MLTPRNVTAGAYSKMAKNHLPSSVPAEGFKPRPRFWRCVIADVQTLESQSAGPQFNSVRRHHCKSDPYSCHPRLTGRTSGASRIARYHGTDPDGGASRFDTARKLLHRHPAQFRPLTAPTGVQIPYGTSMKSISYRHVPGIGVPSVPDPHAPGARRAFMPAAVVSG